MKRIYLIASSYVAIGIGIPLCLSGIVGGIVAESWKLFAFLATLGGGLIGYGVFLSEQINYILNLLDNKRN